jgi:osmotically-inducible protein OsmY
MRTDNDIEQDVTHEIEWEPILRDCKITVGVKRGIVTLCGSVDTYAKKIAAESAANNVFGVKTVDENIDVEPFSPYKRTDADIADAVISALRWHTAVKDDTIKIKVEDGWVALEGEVEWDFERRSIETQIENLNGVIGIIDNIKIKPRLASDDNKSRIIDAFKRSATVDSGKIRIDINGPKITLNGKVRSYAEKQSAEDAAWFAPGVNEVNNQLEIDSEVFIY